MSKLSILIGALCCALLTLAVPAFAANAAATAGAAAATAAAGRAEVRLQAWQVQTVVEQASVKERLQPLPSQIRPGDVVEYEARYVNGTGKPAADVQITLPVPAGGLQIQLNAFGDTPPQFASLDGKRYEPLPLKREVRLADGRRATIDVPAAEYRYLRWYLGTLPAGAERAVRARMQLPALAADAAARP